MICRLRCAVLVLNSNPSGTIQELCHTFWGILDPPPPVSHSVTPDSTPTNIMSHWNHPPNQYSKCDKDICNISGTCLHRAAFCQQNCIHQPTLCIDCLLCKTKYVTLVQQMGHSNSKSSQKLAVCQSCILQQMSQNFSAESFQCESALAQIQLFIIAGLSYIVTHIIIH